VDPAAEGLEDKRHGAYAQGFWSKSHDAMLKAPSLVRPLIQFRFDASVGLGPFQPRRVILHREEEIHPIAEVISIAESKRYSQWAEHDRTVLGCI